MNPIAIRFCHAAVPLVAAVFALVICAQAPGQTDSAERRYGARPNSPEAQMARPDTADTPGPPRLPGRAFYRYDQQFVRVGERMFPLAYYWSGAPMAIPIDVLSGWPAHRAQADFQRRPRTSGERADSDWARGHWEEVAVQDVVEGEFVDVYHPAVYRMAADGGDPLLLEPERTTREPKVRIMLTRVWVEGSQSAAPDTPPRETETPDRHRPNQDQR